MKILHYIWQLPQHILALIILVLYYNKLTSTDIYNTSKVYWLKDIRWGVSLGQYIFLGKRDDSTTVVKHEYGHSIQSKRWGIFYLIFVGLPSILMNIVASILYIMGQKEMMSAYYKRWPESEADRLGGVKRN